MNKESRPPGSAKFLPEGEGREMKYKEGSVAVWRGKTDAGVRCIAMRMKHATGNNDTMLLSLNGAAAMVILLADALSPNDGTQRPGDAEATNATRATPPGSLQPTVRRIGRWIAHRCGLLVVTPEKVLEWTRYAREYNLVAGDYDLSDARLSGLNDGRCQSLNRCCQDVRELNSPDPRPGDSPKTL